MTQPAASEISCFASPPPLWDISDGMDDNELRGPALYDALMDLKPSGLSEYAWAERAGLNRGFLNDLKKSEMASPRTSSLNKLLAVAGKSVADLYRLETSAGRTEAREIQKPFSSVDLPKDVPIRGTAAGAEIEIEDGGRTHRIERTLVEPDPTGFARRPPSLAGNRTVYAIYITGESMMPRFRPGDLSYVDPSRAPHIGDDVIVQFVDEPVEGADPSEVSSILVKELVGRTATHFELAQHNPPVRFKVEKRRVLAIHRIVPLSELLS